jgi:hypothetical protein
MKGMKRMPRGASGPARRGGMSFMSVIRFPSII